MVFFIVVSCFDILLCHCRVPLVLLLFFSLFVGAGVQARSSRCKLAVINEFLAHKGEKDLSHAPHPPFFLCLLSNLEKNSTLCVSIVMWFPPSPNSLVPTLFFHFFRHWSSRNLPWVTTWLPHSFNHSCSSNSAKECHSQKVTIAPFFMSSF